MSPKFLPIPNASPGTGLLAEELTAVFGADLVGVTLYPGLLSADTLTLPAELTLEDGLVTEGLFVGTDLGAF